MSHWTSALTCSLLLASMSTFAAAPLSSLKKLEDNGLGGSILGSINACQPLAPSPFGSFVPPNVTVAVPAVTVTTSPVTLGGPFPITIPGQTLTIPANTVTIPGSAFLPPAPRLCPVSASGDISGDPPQPPGHSSFNLQLTIDFSTYRSNGSGGGCSQASGTLTLRKEDGGASQDRLTMTNAGLLCDNAGIGSPKTYTATYYITGQTGKYAGASGTGAVAVSFDSAQTIVHLDGNVLFP